MQRQLSHAATLLLLLLGLLTGHLAAAQVVQKPAIFSDPSFSSALVVTGINSPTTMAFAPASDGRIFVCQQDGSLRVVKNNALLAVPFVKLSVNADGERGLIGVALDPDFLSNHYLYLYYTLPSGANNRIVRYTADGDLALAGSEKVILDLDPLVAATNHNGGAMHFGKDGKLYVAVGENTRRDSAQRATSYFGKMLRLNSDGSAPSDNPFASSQSDHARRVWSTGLRNPYTFSIEPGTGKIFVNNVGEVSWEEINDASVGGRNFGWPTQPGGEGYTAGPGQTAPTYAYPHQAGSPDGTGCAITGGTFFTPAGTNYPAQYRGKYFFMDYCGKWINYFDPSSPAPSKSRQPFAQQIGNGDVVGLETGPDGNLYYLARNGSALFKIVYTASTSAPVITKQPQNGSVAAGAAATFSVEAAGSTPLSYQWQKNGATIAGATASSYTIASATAADAGQYRAVVTNSVGSATSNATTLTVTAPNAAPTARILTPAGGTTYVAGTTISFSGDATDPEDGALPASAFSWVVEFHHNVHFHPGPAIAAGVKSGTFPFANTGEESADVFYRLLLTVTDKGGLTNTTSVDIQPQKSTIVLASSPAGLPLTFNSVAQATPYSAVSVEGFQNQFGAPSPQTLNGVSYQFVSWSDGGAQTHTIATPTDDVTYTATFKAAPPASGGQAVTSLTLFNADTDLPLAGYDPLPSGATLNLATLPTRNLNIRANPNPATVGSVRFAYDGNANYKIEGLAPYAIGGDNGTIDGRPNYNAWTPAVGSHTLTVTPYTGGGAGGTAGTPLTVNFTVTNDAGAVALRTPENPAGTTAGLDYAYYEGSYGSLPPFATLTPVKTGTTAIPDLTPRLHDDNFAFRYTGYVTVPTDSVYTFYTNSDDGSRLAIGSTVVVDNDGLHGNQEKSGPIGLKAGTHALTVTFFELGGDQVLGVSYAGPSLSKQAIPAAAFSRNVPATVAQAKALVVKAAGGAPTFAAVQLYPNPARDEVAIRLEATAPTEVQVAVYDALGQCVARLSRPAQAGANTLRLPLGQLATGVYSVAVRGGAGGQCVRRLVVVK